MDSKHPVVVKAQSLDLGAILSSDCPDVSAVTATASPEPFKPSGAVRVQYDR
jgi:hypothetical protein